MTAVHAEITADQGHIVLLAGGLGMPEEVMLAAKKLELLTPLLSKSDPPGAMTMPATWPAVVQLRATFGSDLVVHPGLQAWTDAEASRRLFPPAIPQTLPDGLTPYPWQTTGADMIAATGRALITDEPGTGKTITTILGLLALDDTRPGEYPWPAVVVCPASVVDSWVDAVRTWAPHLLVTAWRGPKRKALAGGAHIYVTSYDTARMDAGVGKPGTALLELKPASLVVDECHLIKNHRTQRSQAVRRLARKVGRDGAVIALSGTPITHHPGNLWPSLDALEHDAWPSSERWVARYCQSLERDYKTEILGLDPYAEPEFRLTLLGQHRRVAKADVLTALPPKVYSTRTVDLPPAWRKVYDDFEDRMLAELPDGTELRTMDVLTKFGHLSRLASAAADVDITVETDPATGLSKERVHLELKAPSWKVDALLEILEERPGQPVVVFAPSRQLAMLASKAAIAAGRKTGLIVGGQAAGARTAAVAAFQGGELDLICATTGAGGVGLTLTAARTVVFLQRPWSLVESLQAEDRCHRIGSEIHDSIEIIDVVARDTLDTRVRAVLRERAGQLADLVQDPRIVTELLGGRGVTEHRAAS